MATKIALVSIGKIARDQHIPAISDSADWELSAAVSRNTQVDGVANFADMDTMLAACADTPVVSLCMPPSARFEYAAKAIAAGKHVMLEKPPGATISECLALVDMAEKAGVTLFATWHSRYAHGVAAAKDWLADKTLKSLRVTWKEDVRRWHPGQDWIWQPGGLGVFDPGINALSIVTEILPVPVHLSAATLEFPANRDTPIATDLTFVHPTDAEVSAVFDWRQEGPQTWDIDVICAEGGMSLTDGGAKFWVDGILTSEGPDREYPNLYARMADLVKSGKSDTDLAPMIHVADAFALGRRQVVEPFEF